MPFGGEEVFPNQIAIAQEVMREMDSPWIVELESLLQPNPGARLRRIDVAARHVDLAEAEVRTIDQTGVVELSSDPEALFPQRKGAFIVPSDEMRSTEVP